MLMELDLLQNNVLKNYHENSKVASENIQSKNGIWSNFNEIYCC